MDSGTAAQAPRETDRNHSAKKHNSLITTGCTGRNRLPRVRPLSRAPIPKLHWSPFCMLAAMRCCWHSPATQKGEDEWLLTSSVMVHGALGEHRVVLKLGLAQGRAVGRDDHKLGCEARQQRGVKGGVSQRGRPAGAQLRLSRSLAQRHCWRHRRHVGRGFALPSCCVPRGVGWVGGAHPWRCAES